MTKGAREYPNAFPVRKTGANTYTITVARHIGEAVYPLNYLYVAEFTDTGFEFRPLIKIMKDVPLPEWAARVRENEQPGT